MPHPPFAPLPTNLVGVLTLTYWYRRLRLAASPVVGLLVSAFGSSCHHYANPFSVARAIPRWWTPLDDGSAYLLESMASV
jgi:hypothetical protein